MVRLVVGLRLPDIVVPAAVFDSRPNAPGGPKDAPVDLGRFQVALSLHKLTKPGVFILVSLGQFALIKLKRFRLRTSTPFSTHINPFTRKHSLNSNAVCKTSSWRRQSDRARAMKMTGAERSALRSSQPNLSAGAMKHSPESLRVKVGGPFA